MTDIDTLAAGIRAGLDAEAEDAQQAAASARGMGLDYDEPVRWRNSEGNVSLDGGYGGSIAVGGYDSIVGDEVANHIARHDPAAVLARVARDRRLLDLLLAEKHTPRESCAAVRDNPDLVFATDAPCTCGRDARVAAYLALLAEPYLETT